MTIIDGLGVSVSKFMRSDCLLGLRGPGLVLSAIHVTAYPTIGGSSGNRHRISLDEYPSVASRIVKASMAFDIVALSNSLRESITLALTGFAVMYNPHSLGIGLF